VLTGLPGRALFLERVARMHAALGTGPRRRLALLFVDLDGFKAVNDQLGHEQGDRVLVRTAEILRSLIRGVGMAARVGGDEFVVCLTAPSDAIGVSALPVATRLVEEVSGIGSGIGCSVGVAVWTDRCPDLASVMRRADEAMFEAKRCVKNQCILYDESGAHGDVATA
jgi:diguanylate cyclase (GGDEF)-like protein